MADKRFQTQYVLDADALDKEIQQGLQGAYLFFGEEDYLKQVSLTKIRNQILTAEGFELFNHVNLSFTQSAEVSRDELFQKLVDSMDTVPMMQEKVLVEVHDLQIDKLKQDEIDMVCNAAKKASEETILVIFCRDLELPCVYNFDTQKAYKSITAVAKPVRFQLLSKGKLAGYIKKYLAREQVLITEDAVELLCEMCSYRLYPLLGEMSKLASYMGSLAIERKEVNVEIVKNICSETADDELPFALSEAMQKWHVVEMFDALQMSKDQKEDPIIFVAKLAKIYSEMLQVKAGMISGMNSIEIAKALRMKQYKCDKYYNGLSRVPINVIEKAVEKVFELDLKLKSTMTDPWTLVEIFISDIYMPKAMKEATHA